MAENSGISWTDHTFNPWMGCTKVSPACKNCYAERDMDHRYGKVAWGPTGTRVLTSDANWAKPIKWNREAAEKGIRYRVFCASLADVFEDWKGPIHNSSGREVWNDGRGFFVRGDNYQGNGSLATMNDIRKRLFALIDATPNLDWLLLTKRPENIAEMWPKVFCDHHVCEAYKGSGVCCPDDSCDIDDNVRRATRPNVWLGTSVENQEYANTRIPELTKCRDLSPVLFLSCEPLLGVVNIRSRSILYDGSKNDDRGYPLIDWVIAGGESGPGARPSHPDWFRALRDQCEAAGVPFHFKQWGEWHPTRKARHSDLSCDAKKQIILKPDGQETTGFLEYGVDAVVMDQVGVKQAGRMLDSVLHDAFPELVASD